MNLNQSPPSQGSAAGSAPGFAVGAPEFEDFLSTDSPVPPRGAQISFTYNVPDAFESDQEVVRSEMMFYNTPLTERYSEQVYGVVKNVQAQCAADVQRICPKSAPYMSLNKLMAQLMMPMEDQRIYRGRRLMSAPLKTGADYVNYVRSFYSPLRMIKHAHPLSAAVHLDEKTGNLVGHGKKDKDAQVTSHVRINHNQAIGEGRLAAPGWKMPVEKPRTGSDASTEEVGAATEAVAVKSSAVPRSHAAAAPGHGHHHNHDRRNLRLAAPGWTPPSPSAPSAAAGGVPAEVRSVLDRAEPSPSLDAVGPVDGGKAPCAKPFQPQSAPFFTLDRFFAPQAQTQTQQLEEPLAPELIDAVPSFGASSTGPAFSDFRSFVLDFLSGRDVSLSLTLPYTVVLDSSHEGALYLDNREVQQGEDGADYDGYYSYYATDEAGADLGVGYYDDDGANYAYDDATGLDDDGEEMDGAEGGDDDDFFAQRFDMLPAGRKMVPPQDHSEEQPQMIECGGAAGGPTQMLRRPLVQAQPRAQGRARTSILTFLGGRRGPGGSSEEDGDQLRSPSEEGPGAGSASSEEEDGNHHGHHDHDHHHHGPPKPPAGRLGRPAGRPHGQVGPPGPPPPPGGRPRPGDRADDDRPRPPRGPPGGPGSSEDEEDGHHHRHHHHGPPPPPPHPPVPEDHSFSGNLGFGADNDMCLYRGMAQGRVSPPCQAAVGELYQLRAEYWEESQQQDDFHHHHGGLGLLIIGLVLLVCCVRRFYAARYEKKVRSLLTALHTHPHLKASVEAETGLEIPAPVPAGTCCVGASTEGSSSSCDKSLLVRAGKMAVFASLVFAVSFAVSYSALEITMRIVNEMDKHAEEDPYTGEDHYTSPLAALFILFMVCVAELTLVALVVRGVKAIVMRRHARQAFMAGTSEGEAPSAPLEGSSSHGFRSSGGRGGGLSQSAQQVWMSLPTANLFGRGRRNGGSPRGGDGYAVLLTEEDREEAMLGRSAHGHGHGTEMVSVSNNMSAYPAQYTPHSAARAAPAPQQQTVQYAYMPAGPVTARPVNGVSMV